ncbi:Zinc finger, CCHC-type [Thalictrum thalictroides]|uniref:Zinc finger, CCHC-type n=1 Tax=Thalictrum thalictroides TaxID=46969 RepID=A0A7J6UZH2_THATH|nr:Zinc finger, CCHC-type [Thalictrum thalictroides]
MEASPIVDKKGKGRDNNVTHQPPYSTHPMVNGTMEYRNVCWKCGNGPNADGPRHDSRQCIGPVLENWETEILKSKHHERNERVFGGEVKERQTETFPQDLTQPSTDAVTEIELRKRQRYERAQLPQPYIYSKLDQVHESSVEEMSIEELIALEMSLNKDKEFVNVIEGDIDEYLLDEPIAFSPQHSLQYGNNKERIIDDKVPLSEAEVLFSAHVVERENAKRPRHHHHIINDEDIEPLPKTGLSPDEVYSNRVKTNSRRRKVEPLINARLEDGPLNYMEILDRTKVEISLKDLAQMSPAARKHWKHGMSRVNDKRSRRKRSQAEISEISLKAQFEADRNPVKNTRFDLPDLSDSSSMVSVDIQKTRPKKLPSGPQGITFKSFRVEAKVKIELAGKIRHISLDIDYTHVDQGADLNLISHELAKILKLPSIKLPQPIFFGTAEGRLTSATHYTEIKIGVSGIWRHAEALLLPPTSGNPRSLILGLPWLFDVCGSLNIPKFTLTIGDPEKGEIVVNIQTTKFKFGQNNRLRLVLAEKRTIELAKAQITAKNNRNQKNSRIQTENLSDTESDYENSSGTSENEDETNSVSSKSSGKESVTGVTIKRLPIRTIRSQIQ